MSSWKTSDGVLRIPIWLGNNLPSFEYSRKIALTTSLQKARRSRDSLPLSFLMQYNTHSPWRTKSTIQTNGYHHHFFIQMPICVWPRCDPFFWQNPCFGCNIEIDLVVALEYTSFDLFPTPKKFLLSWQYSEALLKAPCCHSNQPHKLHSVFALHVRCAVQSGHIPFFAAVCPRW